MIRKRMKYIKKAQILYKNKVKKIYNTSENKMSYNSKYLNKHIA